MQIKISKADLFYVGVIGALVGMAVASYKKEAKQKKEFELHKKGVLGDRDLEKEVYDASIKNTRLSAGDRAEVADILTRHKDFVDNATTTSSLDLALANFDIVVNKFKIGTDDEIRANMIYYTKKLAQLDKENEMERQLEADKKNAEMIANSIKLLSSIAIPASSGLSASLSTT